MPSLTASEKWATMYQSPTVLSPGTTDRFAECQASDHRSRGRGGRSQTGRKQTKFNVAVGAEPLPGGTLWPPDWTLLPELGQVLPGSWLDRVSGAWPLVCWWGYHCPPAGPSEANSCSNHWQLPLCNPIARKGAGQSHRAPSHPVAPWFPATLACGRMPASLLW